MKIKGAIEVSLMHGLYYSNDRFLLGFREAC